jgi:hypothetical protein
MFSPPPPRKSLELPEEESIEESIMKKEKEKIFYKS